MPSITAVLLAAALASLTASKPVPGTSKTSTCVQSVKKAYRPGPVHLANVYRKYTAEIPTDVAAAAAAARDGSAIATPEKYDVAYLIPVTIGGQTLNLDLDTGSSDL